MAVSPMMIKKVAGYSYTLAPVGSIDSTRPLTERHATAQHRRAPPATGRQHDDRRWPECPRPIGSLLRRIKHHGVSAAHTDGLATNVFEVICATSARYAAMSSTVPTSTTVSKCVSAQSSNRTKEPAPSAPPNVTKTRRRLRAAMADEMCALALAYCAACCGLYERR